MTLSLALTATAALLAAEPSSLPAGHPTVGADRPAASSPGMGAMPPGHPTVGSAPAAPTDPSSLPQGHPAMSGRGAPTADELLKQLEGMQGLREREKTFEVASSLGKLYYASGRFEESIPYLQQAEDKAKPTRALFLDQRKKLGAKAVPGEAEANCGFTAQMALEERAKVAVARAKKGDAAGAAGCARAALELSLDVESMRANALFMTNDAPGALKVYQQVLEVAPTYADALFGRSAVLYETRGDDLQALHDAHAGFEAFIAAHPNSSRTPLARKLSRMTDEAEKAGGMTKWLASRDEDRRIRAAKLDLPREAPMMAQAPGARAPASGRPAEGASAPMVSQETMDAMNSVERTPELEAQLDETVAKGEDLLANGRYDEALLAYRQVMPLRPDGRVKAGLAWTLVGLGKPTAERVWGVAVSSDPAAVDKLGETLKAKGDTRGAKALWARLAASAPDYAARASLQAKMDP